MTNKRGRPATGIKRVSFQVSCNISQRDAIKQKAKECNKTISQYLLDLVGI